MYEVYKKNLKKSLAHLHHLERLQVRSLYFLQEKEKYAALISETVTILPQYVFRKNMDALVMHLQFYMQVLNIDGNEQSMVCEIQEQIEGAKNYIHVMLGKQHVTVGISLKGVEKVRTLPMPIVFQDWYHVRVVAFQTKVTVTVSSQAKKKMVFTIHIP